MYDPELEQVSEAFFEYVNRLKASRTIEPDERGSAVEPYKPPPLSEDEQRLADLKLQRAAYELDTLAVLSKRRRDHLHSILEEVHRRVLAGASDAEIAIEHSYFRAFFAQSRYMV
jgi:hypothetical protein